MIEKTHSLSETVVDQTHDKEANRLNLLYHSVFATPDGREVLNDLLEHSTIVAPMLDTHEALAFAEGQRSVILTVIRRAGYDLGIQSQEGNENA